jgi:hypothetical protein
LIIDGPKPYLLWYAAGFIGILSTLGFLALHRAREKEKKMLDVMPEAAVL